MENCKAEVRITLPSQRIAKAISLALRADISPPAGESIAVSQKGSEMILKIESDDLAQLRATLNSIIRLAEASYHCIQTAK